MHQAFDDLMRTRLRRAGLLLAVSSALCLASCTSSSTSVTAPTSGKCEVTAASSVSSYTASGGTGSVSVTASRDCTWSASVDSSWISLQTRNGQGEAVVPFTVAANPTASARSAAITVSGDRVTVNQAGAPCSFDLDRSGDSIGAAGGPLLVSVTTLAGCAWTASAAVPWISVRSGQNGAGSGGVTLTVSRNDGNDRTATVTIATHPFTVAQSTPGHKPPNPPPPNPPPNPGTTVEFGGRVSSLSGSCPDVTFSIGLATIVADMTTSYKHGSCDDLRNGRSIKVTGTANFPLSISATSIDLKGGDEQ